MKRSGDTSRKTCQRVSQGRPKLGVNVYHNWTSDYTVLTEVRKGREWRGEGGEPYKDVFEHEFRKQVPEDVLGFHTGEPRLIPVSSVYH